MPVKVFAVLVLHKVAGRLGLLVDVVGGVALDVRVDDGDHPAAVRRQIVLQLRGVGEEVLVPCEVPAAVGACMGMSCVHSVRAECNSALMDHAALLLPGKAMQCIEFRCWLCCMPLTPADSLCTEEAHRLPSVCSMSSQMTS